MNLSYYEDQCRFLKIRGERKGDIFSFEQVAASQNKDDYIYLRGKDFEELRLKKQKMMHVLEQMAEQGNVQLNDYIVQKIAKEVGLISTMIRIAKKHGEELIKRDNM